MKVAVIGQGYVGLPLAISIANAGHEVIGFDVNPKITDQLNSGVSHIEDIKNSELNTVIEKIKYRATSDPKLLSESEIAIIAVPTPLDENRNPDISFVESASRILGESLRSSALIVNESTSYPGTLREVIAPMVAKHSPAGIKHRFAVSPERVDPGNEKWKIKNTPRLMAGLDSNAGKEVVDFYSTFCDEITLLSSPEVAESAKLFENTFRQVNIALVNEFSLICRALGISVHEVLDAANTKPYGFMKFTPGIGVGGHCIPVDPSFLAFAAEKLGADAKFIQLANEVNFNRPEAIIHEISRELKEEFKDKSVLLVGISYKPNISDVRESPALRFMEALRKKNEVSWYDPIVGSWNGETSSILDKIKYDVVIFSNIHAGTPINELISSGKLIIDLTGKIEGAINL